jgi:MFS family permease
MIGVVGSGLMATQMTTLLGDSSKASWLSMVLTIFIVAINPMLSQMADYWGRKWILVITSVGGVAGPIIISRAQNITALITGFCILGIPFGSQSSFYSVVSEVLPRKHRSVAQASLNVSMSLAALTAILMGGALLRHGDYDRYRIFWYVVAGIYALGLIGVVLGYSPPHRELQDSLTWRQKLASLDWVGVTLLTTGMVTFCTALQWSRNPYSWSNAHVNAPFVTGTVLTAAFIGYEWLVRKDGILHHGLFVNRNFAIALVTIFIEGLAYFTCNSYFTYQTQVMSHLDLFSSGLRFMVFFLTASVSAIAVGFYTTWTHQLREPLVFSYICFTLFNALMASVKSSTSIDVFWGYPVLGGLGIGALLTNLTVIVQMSTPKSMISVATGLLITVRGLGGCVGLAVDNAIFTQALSSNLGSKVAAAVIPLGFPASEIAHLIPALQSGNPAVMGSVPNVTPVILEAGSAAMTEAYVIAFRGVWTCAAAFSAAGFIGKSPLFLNGPELQVMQC